MATIIPRWDSVTPECRRAFEFLRSQPFVRDFYLAGGTALALQLGHRVSKDLDWFSAKALLPADERERIARMLEQSGDFQSLSERDGMLFTRLLGAEVSFLYLRVPPVEPTINLDGVALASLADIGLMKLVAIRDRGTRRDFVDLYCLKDAVSLSRLVELAEVKYAEYPDMLPTIARGLAYFDDADRDDMPKTRPRVRWSDVKKYAEAGAKAIVQRERAKWKRSH